jgi:hypothetical protein
MLRLPQQAGAASQPAGRTLGARRPRRTRPRTQPTAHAPGYLAAALRRSARRAGGRSLPPAAHTGRVDGRSAAPRCARRAEAGAVAHGWKAAACEAAAAAAHAASTIFRVMRADPRPAACHAPSPPTVSLPGAWTQRPPAVRGLLNIHIICAKQGARFTRRRPCRPRRTTSSSVRASLRTRKGCAWRPFAISRPAARPRASCSCSTDTGARSCIVGGGGWRAARSLPDICWRVAQLAHAVRVAARPGTGRAAHKVRRHGR